MSSRRNDDDSPEKLRAQEAGAAAARDLGRREEVGSWKARFAAMTHAELVDEAARWCFSTLRLRADRRHILEGTAALLTESDQRLSRLWALADHRKKSVPMDKFMAAFDAGSLGWLSEMPADGVDPGDELPWTRDRRPETIQAEGDML